MQAGAALGLPQCSRSRRKASASSQKARAAGTSSANPLASSSWRRAARSSRQTMPLVMSLRRCQVGVSISSRYCSFCAAARVAASSRNSPVWLGSVPPNFREGSKEMVVPGHACRRDEAAHGKGVDQCVVEALVLGNVGGRNIARFANELRLRARIDRLRFASAFVSTQRPSSPPTRMKVSAYMAPSK
jgi:hypothetical protein